MSAISTEDLLSTALEAAEAAAAVHERYATQRGAFRTVEKGQSDFVTEADLAAQHAALSLIMSRHPTHGILAEEDEGAHQDLGQQPIPSRSPFEAPSSSVGTPPNDAQSEPPLWIVDPLDGTTNFLHGHPMFAASVAVVVDGRPTAGAVVAAATDERWWASRNGGAYLNGEPIRVSGERNLRNALIGTGFPFKSLPLLPDYLEQLGRILRNTSGIRRLGSAALDLCYLATGRLDAFWELELGPWDVAAGMVIVEEAGGLVTGLSGEAVDLTGPGGYLAANSAELHQALAALVHDNGGSS
jgi:myo-inositol-1(or 4)-monophosphatase